MHISLYICSFFLLNYVGQCFAGIDLSFDEGNVEKWTKNPLCFSGFRGCGGATMSLASSSLVMEINNCGNVASSKLDKSYTASHIKFFWGQENPLASDDPGKIKGSEHTIDGKANTMEVQFFFYDPKGFDGLEHSVLSNGFKVVSVFLQTDTRIIDNPKFSQIIKYVRQDKRFQKGQKLPLRSSKWVPKIFHRKTEKSDSGPSRKMSGLFDAFFGVFNTANKRVLHYNRHKLKFRNNEVKAEVFVIEEAIPVSPEQVYAFWKLIPDFGAPHVSASAGEDFDVQVYAGPKY